MSESIDRRFDRVAEGYASSRPHCPPALAASVAEHCSAHDLAWEPGCGSGQVTGVLAPYFKEVVASDPAESAIAQAPTIGGVRFTVGTADGAGLEDGSVDLIASGQAAHWFNMDAFARECRRIARPDAMVALWCYDRPRVAAGIDALVDTLYFDVLRGLWDEGRRHIDERYRSLAFPFEETRIDVPDYGACWSGAQMLAYLRTWSAVDAYAQRGQGDAVAHIEAELTRVWGEGDRQVRWPVGMRAGRVHG